MDAKWMHSPPQTLDRLYAKDPLQIFLHNDIIYAAVVQWAIVPGGTLYLALPIGADRGIEILGSTVVTPVTPAPSHLI